jgi:hypothetical protein
METETEVHWHPQPHVLTTIRHQRANRFSTNTTDAKLQMLEGLDTIITCNFRIKMNSVKNTIDSRALAAFERKLDIILRRNNVENRRLLGPRYATHAPESVNLYIIINNSEFCERFFILDDPMRTACTLGQDFFARHRFTVDFHNQAISDHSCTKLADITWI